MDYELTEQQRQIYENIIEDLEEVRNGDIFGECRLQCLLFQD